MINLGDGIELYHGDCLDVMPMLPSHSFELIAADIPYGKTRCAWDVVIPFESMWNQLKRLVKPRGTIVLFGMQPFTSALVMSNLAMFRYEWIYEKNCATGHLHAKMRPMRAHENILVFGASSHHYYPQKTTGHEPTRGGSFKGEWSSVYGGIKFNVPSQNKGNTDRFPRSVQYFKRERRFLHSTQKPLKLMEYLIRTYTQPRESVLDFTYGSCTTGVAAINNDRYFTGIEKDKHYFEVGMNRLLARINEIESAMKGIL